MVAAPAPLLLFGTSQLALLVTRQVQPRPVVIRTEPIPPPAAAIAVCFDSERPQIALCLIVRVSPPIVSEADRAARDLFAFAV
jgi:hypothetical protein